MVCGKDLEIWAGVECTINRVGDQYFDQNEYSGHYNRGVADAELIASLGVKMVRYGLLWEHHQPVKDGAIDWSFAEKNLEKFRELNVVPIAGLVHHGSGPRHVNFFDGSFEHELAAYAREVAQKFPWLEYYTPVNEPLTTARFCGLYGHWYPHGKDDYSFYKVLLSECKATVMAMKAIRQVNPDAKLIQTEDLGRCYSTPLLAYQAELENNRRWLSYDLLCGRVDESHYMWNWLIKAGINPEEILYFTRENCVPHIAGFNYYITSERYLDENLSAYPEQYHGGNYRHRYADIETVKVPMTEENGPALLLSEAWEHLGIPLAITECHLHSTREDQIRWFHTMWKTVLNVRDKGADIRAITAWAVFGLYGWNCLVTKPCGDYEPGVFNLASGVPRPTALAGFLRELALNKSYYHPILENEGWWQRESRQQYGRAKIVRMSKKKRSPGCRPLLVLGKTGTLGAAFGNGCRDRNIHHLLLSREELDLTNSNSIEKAVHELDPWGIINAGGFVNVDKAEEDERLCMQVNCDGPALLAKHCKDKNIRFISFSSDLVFDGEINRPYVESDPTNPLSVYGRSKAASETKIFENNSEALVIRTSSFFGPWDVQNFVAKTLSDLKQDRLIRAADDVYVSPTYIPDLVQLSLDLLLDGDTGIYHVSNGDVVSWFGLAEKVAHLASCDPALLRPVPHYAMQWKATRPRFTALESERGIKLPSLDNALERCFEMLASTYRSRRNVV